MSRRTIHSRCAEIGEIMNIMLAFNTNYLNYAAVLIRSLIENEQENIEIHIIHSSLTDKETRFLESLTSGFDSVNYHYYYFDNSIFDNMPHASYLSKETYFRLLGWTYLPASADRILYLDCDIVINSSLTDFYHQDFDNNLICACPGLGRIPDDIPLQMIKYNLNITQDIKYCNAGVLLLNLDLMRTEVTTDAISSYIDRYKDVLYMADQDIINGFFAGRIKYCNPLRYNYPAKKYIMKKYGPSVAKEATIIHYCVKHKPDSWKYTGTLSTVFWKYAIMADPSLFTYHCKSNKVYRLFSYIFSPLYNITYKLYIKIKQRKSNYYSK